MSAIDKVTFETMLREVLCERLALRARRTVDQDGRPMTLVDLVYVHDEDGENSGSILSRIGLYDKSTGNEG